MDTSGACFAHSVLGWVLFEMSKMFPKAQVDFPSSSVTKYAVRITRGGQGHIRMVLQRMSYVAVSISSPPRATKHPQDECQAEGRVRLCG